MIEATRAAFAACVLVLVLVWTPRVEAQETFADARELYTSAAYGDALAMLNNLAASNRPREERQSIELYRVLCLVALGRKAEADQAIEAAITRHPLYRPTGENIPPRIRAAFTDARKRMLPVIIQQKYTESKTAFDREEFAASAAGFRQVLDALADPEIADAAAQPPLADLRTLAEGFHDLSAKAAAPRDSAPARAQPAPERIYSADHPAIVPPITIRQTLPSFRGKVMAASNGIIEVIIDTSGAVESVRMAVPINPAYDGIVISAAKGWLYEPAKVNGVPVKFRKLVRISLLPTR